MRINTIRLRLGLGILGMLLPIIVLTLCLIFGYGIPDSISATYYLDPTIVPFMIILGSASITLICYMGYDSQDDIICTIAGIFALMICLFPCKTEGLIDHWNYLEFPEYVGIFQLPAVISGWIHNISAIGFFALLSYNSYFLFTKGSDNLTPNKRKRNIIYKVCGIGMAVSFVAIIPVSIFKLWGGLWLIETIALAFFGISWLTKADIFPFLFCDSPYSD